MPRTQLVVAESLCFSVVLATFSVVYAGAEEAIVASDVRSATQPVSMASYPAIDLVTDPKVSSWVKFQSLAKQWRQERGAMSSITQMSSLPSYQKIIGMGEEALPMILAEIKAEGEEPDQWFWALRALTDTNPVQPEDQGNFSKMAAAWLKWGESEGYVW